MCRQACFSSDESPRQGSGRSGDEFLPLFQNNRCNNSEIYPPDARKALFWGLFPPKRPRFRILGSAIAIVGSRENIKKNGFFASFRKIWKRSGFFSRKTSPRGPEKEFFWNSKKSIE
jgi:hypothetical protein